MQKKYFLLLSFFTMGCRYADPSASASIPYQAAAATDPGTIMAIALPEGYTRLAINDSSFGSWLRLLRLKKDKTVYLYNGQPKRNQQAQYAVIDIPVGNKDLQQCADAIMRLRAEFLLWKNDIAAIRFKAGDGTWLCFADWLKGTRYRVSANRIIPVQTGIAGADTRKSLEAYLEFVFSYCGTYTLQQMMIRVRDTGDLRPGDAFVKAGSPGHAMIVVDAAIDAKGNRQFLLAQSYMPAQDIHIVHNPAGRDGSPWYEAGNLSELITPEWTFYGAPLYRW